MSYQNLFVAKLPRNVNDNDLEQIFVHYNPINAKVMLDASTGKSKGFGFVYFNSEEEGKKAYHDLNRKGTRACRHYFNLVIYPSQHNGKAAVCASPALYIRNIPVSVPQMQVKQFLSSFGTLLYCAMREDHYGNPVWVVYAEYDSLESSKNALEKLHGTSHHFQGPPVMVKYADSEEAKRERRRRREEGKLGSAPASRGAFVFPPPRPAPGDAPAVSAPVPAISPGPAPVPAPVIPVPGAVEAAPGAVPSSASLASLASVGHNASIASSSAASSVHKGAEAVLGQQAARPVYFEPAALQRSVYPVNMVYPVLPPQEAPAPQGNEGSGAVNVLMLGNGQRLLVASNAVNVPPANPSTLCANGVGWPVEPTYNPVQMQINVVPPVAFMPF